ncbi:MAG: hypothetical protein OEO77_02390 [Acidimicrobiia bacterium]|nr:hypothetical protein [Acidimicrobiia bacterium]
MADILGIDTLFAEMILGLGLALLAGNGFAMYQHGRGKRPEVEDGVYHPGRARWLMSVGLLMALWGAASLLS